MAKRNHQTNKITKYLLDNSHLVGISSTMSHEETQKPKQIATQMKSVAVRLKRLSLADIDRINKDLGVLGTTTSSVQNVKTRSPIGRLTRSRAQKLGIDVQCENSQAIKKKTSKRKLDDDDQKSKSKKRKIDDGQCEIHYESNNSQAEKKSPNDNQKGKSKNIDTSSLKQDQFAKTLAISSTSQSSNVPADVPVGNDSDQMAIPAANSLPTSTVVAQVQFKVGEIVWARIKGYPSWSARIISFPSNKMAWVTWFNDYRKTKLYRTQLYKFLLNFDEFAKRFKDSVGLETAAKEALICYGQDMSANALNF